MARITKARLDRPVVRRTLSEEDIQQHMAILRTHPTFRTIIGMLEMQLAEERDMYENQPANDYTRGRVTMLRDMIKQFRG